MKSTDVFALESWLYLCIIVLFTICVTSLCIWKRISQIELHYVQIP
jgi:hypothetical protein